MMEPRQLSLGIALVDDATFENFFLAPDSANLQALTQVHQCAEGRGDQLLYVWGAAGVGLSHLLRAACHHATHVGRRARYLSLDELLKSHPAELLESVEHLDLLCLDDIDGIAGKAKWERSVFHLYNRLRDSGKQLIIAAHHPLADIGIQLPDLQSRLAWGITYHILPMTDDEKALALQLRAHTRGLELSDEVSHFIISRSSRDMKQLYQDLECLDNASLAEQRRLTIPFVKQVLDL